ncbi:MAG: hypothetical protein JWS10_815 [Cypionkella sp.]|uniref:hypothetical protein n=1 Tax=Cypionkella sp. TaxID=2811411 RepID=UPI00262FCCC5|nr:hypothetical protein [Cypionkella sp.]MDB5658200.1 hypothetical protein [Cypionkella sp.]
MKPLLCLSALMLLTTPAMAQETNVTLHITFDAASAPKLQEAGEMVTVASYFWGDPATGNVLPVNEMGQLYLGAEEATVWPHEQTFSIGHSIAGAPVGNVEAPLVNVNVYSARITDENNLLDCGIVDGPTDALSKSTQEITWKLIGG